MRATTLAGLERMIRPLATRFLPPKTVVTKYSAGRLKFLKRLGEDVPSEIYTPPEELSRILWGICFLSPILNAAGMLKNGECYEIMARQGAAAYLGGTGTWNLRSGNTKEGVYLPFTPYPQSHAASNYLGLPNDGDQINFLRAAALKKLAQIPIGWSVMGSPDYQGKEKLERLVASMIFYQQAGVDFLELNESCPNTAHGKPQDSDLAERLRSVKENFLDQRTRRLPVIVKFSTDTELEALPALLDLLFELGYDGVNLGNTSTNYHKYMKKIHPRERKLFDYFTAKFGGGVSGRPLKETSLELAARAVEHLKAGPPPQEFHVIRTGGIETWQDLEESERAGISLNEWFTGYFEMFARYGHKVYAELFRGLQKENNSNQLQK